MRTHIMISLTVALAMHVSAAGALAESKCTALKYKAAGQAALTKAKCKADAAKSGGTVDPLCLAKADAKLTKKWAKAEAKGDCIAAADLSDGQAAVDAFVAASMDALEPPESTAVCCEGVGVCWHGPSSFTDPSLCAEIGTTAGAPGTICDASTGTCKMPPAGTGQCCFLPGANVCSGAPSLDLAGCVAAGALDYPFEATCEPSGICTVPPLP